VGTRDYFGNPLPAGSGFDIGANEYTAAVANRPFPLKNGAGPIEALSRKYVTIRGVRKNPSATSEVLLFDCAGRVQAKFNPPSAVMATKPALR
jgi:hypothetical protein